MKITLTDAAAQWYEEELDLSEGDYVRFYVRYGGNSQIQPGFSLGIQIESPLEVGASAEINGITYFIESEDSWYFDGKDLSVSFNGSLNEPRFEYK
ncbi:MAG: HesB/YadR/YfhF family protein [Bacillus sp. (in: firmicutes)]